MRLGMAKIEKIFARVMCMVTTVCHYFVNFQHKFWCVVCNNMYTNCTGSMESFLRKEECVHCMILQLHVWVLVLQEDVITS